MTVADMSRRMPAREFLAWMEFDAHYPIGDRRADMRTAMLLAQQTNMNRKRGAKPISFVDFMVVENGGKTPAKAPEADGSGRARISMDTVAFLAAAAHRAGHKMNL